MDEQETRLYDLCFWIADDQSGNSPDSFFDIIKGFVTKAGGTIVSERIPEKRDLAYMIKKQKSAWWAEIQFRLDPAKLAGLKNTLKYEQVILRKLIVMVPERSQKREKQLQQHREKQARWQETKARMTEQEKEVQRTPVDLDTKLKEILQS